MVFGALLDNLGLSGLLRLAIYVLFFGGTILAFALADRVVSIKKLYVAALLCALLTALLVGGPIFPFIELGKFTEPESEERTIHTIYIQDETGTELHYDTRAVPPVQSTRTSALAESMATDHSDTKRIELASFLIENAEVYKHSVLSADQSITDQLRAPRYVDEQQWTRSDLEGTREFQTIRIYERQITYTDENTATNVSSRLVLEVTPANETVWEVNAE